MGREKSQWELIVEENPEHSRWYIQRFRDMAEQGKDIVGEARLIDAMVPPGSHILDAGCGPGRLAGYLASRGHRVVGVDIDPELIEAAREDYPGTEDCQPPTWVVGDLAELDLAKHGHPEPFHAIVCAGNVMTFVAPSSRREILRRFRASLAGDARAVIGFGSQRGYSWEAFFEDVEEAGLRVDVKLSTWDLRPWTPEHDFLVAVLRRA